MLEGYEKDSKALKEEALRICWLMRGGITYDQAMGLSNQERDIIGKISKENLEVTKKTNLPYF